ncbi:MAG: tRNA (adenosine(37)-N6)-dimethylallyltransferase MiaA [bacterium]
MITIITGPTAVGKTNLSLILAQKIPNSIIISVDSRQVYRLMDIGTDKVSPYIRKYIPHYLIDIINPNCQFSVYDFINKSHKIVQFAIKNNKNVIFVGGTVLYVLSLIEGYSLLPTNPNIRKKYENLSTEELKNLLEKIDKKYATNFLNKIKDKRRMVRILEVYEITNQNPLDLWRNNRKIPIDNIIILQNHRSKIYENINSRVDRQISQGLVDEVKYIVKKYPEYSTFKSLKTFGYYEIIQYINRNITLERAIDLIKRNTRRYAKRQISFLKKIKGHVVDLSTFQDNLYRASEHILQFIFNPSNV